MKDDLYNRLSRAAAIGAGLRLSPDECRLVASCPGLCAHLECGLVEWRRIKGFENYEVSERGDVRHGARILKQYYNKRYWHAKVSIYDRKKKQYRADVHRLVALTFIGEPPPGKPFACHKNGRAWENHKENVYWGSHADNVADMIRHASLQEKRWEIGGKCSNQLKTNR